MKHSGIVWAFAFAVSLVAGGCSEDNEKSTSPTVQPAQIAGDWSFYATSPSSDRGTMGPNWMRITQDGKTIGVKIEDAVINDTLAVERDTSPSYPGVVNGNSLSITVLRHSPDTVMTVIGQVVGDSMGGSFSGNVGETGTWYATKGLPVINREYRVYGGANPLNGLEPYVPWNHGYTLLGASTVTDTLFGDYSYYVVVTLPGNIVHVDAVEGSNGAYLTASQAGNVYASQRADGAPDGICAAVGRHYSGSAGGFLYYDSGLGLHWLRVVVP